MEGGELRKSSQSMPALKKAANQYTEEEFVTRLKKRTTVKSLDPSKPEPPLFCPDYGNYMDESEVFRIRTLKVIRKISSSRSKENWLMRFGVVRLD